MRMPILVAAAAIILLLPLTKAAAGDEGKVIGAWRFWTTTDPLTDVVRGIAVVEDAGKIFAVKCDRPGPGSLFVSFLPQRYLGGTADEPDLGKVVTRIDDDPAVLDDWAYIYRSANYMGDGRYTLIERLKQAKRLRVRLQVPDGEVVDAVFDVNGAADAIAAVENACKANG